jgi:hypothetical protein
MRKSTRNLQACTEVGLIEKVLLRVADAEEMLAGRCMVVMRIDLFCCLALVLNRLGVLVNEALR